MIEDMLCFISDETRCCDLVDKFEAVGSIGYGSTLSSKDEVRYCIYVDSTYRLMHP